jgi:hypothetical protein
MTHPFEKHGLAVARNAQEIATRQTTGGADGAAARPRGVSVALYPSAPPASRSTP